MWVVYAVAGISAALDLIVARSVLLRGLGPVGPAALLAAAVASAVFFVLKAAVLLVVLPHRSLFLLVTLAYVHLAVAMPLLGLAVLWTSRRREVHPLVRGTAWLSLVAVPLALWSSFVEPFRLRLEEVGVPLAADRAGTTPLRIGVLSDVQAREVTDFERAAVARIMALHPDLILIPGDLASVWPRSAEDAVEEFRALVAPLEAPLGVWMVLGNTDDPRLVPRVLEGTAVRLLEDETVELVHGNRRITLCGLGKALFDPRRQATAYELEERPGEDDVRILLAHYPDVVELLRPDTRVDLVVSGHTHGGQVRLPLVGPPLTLSRVPRRVAAGGLSDLDGRRVYVSRGLGVERGWAPRLRWNCPPEITLLTLGGAEAR